MAEQLIYEIKLSTEEANRKLDQLINSQNKKSAKAGKTAGDSFGNSFRKAVDTALSAISFTALINGIRGVSGAFLSQEKAQLSLSTQVENYNKQARETGKNLLKIEEIQKSINEQYEKFGGILSKGDLIKVYKELIQGGITSTLELENTLTGFVDIASVEKSEFITMGDAIAQLAEQFRSERASLGETAGLSEEYISQILPAGIKLLEKETGLKNLSVESLTEEQRARAKILGLQAIFQKNQGNYQKQLKKGVLALDQFNAKLREAKIALGSTLAPAFLEALKSLTPLVEQFASFVVQNPQLVESLTKIALGLTGTLTIVKALSLAFGFFVNILMTVAKSLKVLYMLFSANPILSIIALIIVAIVLLVKNWDWLSVRINASLSQLSTKFVDWGNLIKNTFLSVLSSIKNAWGGLADWIKTNIADKIVGAFTELGKAVFGIFDGIKVSVGNAFIWMINQLIQSINYFLKVYDKIKGSLRRAGVNMPDINKIESLNYLTTQAEKNAQQIQARESAQQIVTNIQNIISNNYGRTININNNSGSRNSISFDNYGLT